MSINLDKITTKAELKQVLKFLEEQGFGYIGEWDLHQKKINDIISKNNTLNIYNPLNIIQVHIILFSPLLFNVKPLFINILVDRHFHM